MATTKIIIAGSSGHAKVVIDLVEREGKYSIVGLLDRFRKIGEEESGYKVLGGEEDLPQLIREHPMAGALVALGDNFARSEVCAKISALCPGIKFASAIHPDATIARNVHIGEGTVIMAGACINTACVIGRHCIVNTRASLDHDSAMGDFASLAPGVTTGGNCHIGNFSAIGIGAVLAHRVRVGEHTVVGAGSVALRDIEPYKLAYGTPARAIRERQAGAKYL